MVYATIDYDGGESGSSQQGDEVDEETWAGYTPTSRVDTDADIGDGTSDYTADDPSPSQPPDSAEQPLVGISDGALAAGVLLVAAVAWTVGGGGE